MSRSSLFAGRCTLSQAPPLTYANSFRYSEITDVLARTIVTNVTDLHTLCVLTEQMATVGPTPSEYLPVILQQGINRLSVTLRLPLGFFKSFDALPASPETQHISHDAHSWLQICSAPGFLRTLTTLSVWIDHIGLCSWSVVNERKMLCPLVDQLLHTDTELIIILPKLHPLHECEERHFVTNRMGRKTQVYRKLRQRYHSQEDGHVVCKPDFPFLIDIRESMSMADVEEDERAMWNDGKDVEAFAEMEREPLYGHGNL
jgi:hypothetical protein